MINMPFQNKMFFISSLPRSGSTLLTSLLNQRPDTYASTTSDLSDSIGLLMDLWEKKSSESIIPPFSSGLTAALNSVLDTRYKNVDAKYIFDKGRHWAHPQAIETIIELTGNIKIIATVRPIAECLASIVNISQDNRSVKEICTDTQLSKTLFMSHTFLKEGAAAYPDNILFIEYEDLVENTQEHMDRIADFVSIPHFIHDCHNVPPSNEKDEVYGIKDLYKVRKKVSKQNYSARHVLGHKLWNYYQGGEFWSDKPEPIQEKTAINRQFDVLMAGNFEESKRMAYANLFNNPEDSDIAFNAGWAKLSDGEVAEGYELLDRGRETTAWGDSFQFSQPIWNGEKGTVLLRLERGLGDQLHQVRYARDLKAAGCTVIVSAQSQLAELINTIPEVDVVVQHEAAGGVYHDYVLPAMSAPIQLGYKTNDDIDGTPYIPRPDVDVVPNRVGVRWSGLPAYEHQTKRLFPHELLFNTIKGRGDYINLQRDEGAEHCPNWIEQVDLSTWTDTAKAIASCEFVVTSCTGVAHLSASMGVPTKVIVPLVPYYLWTYPGSSTPYYDSITLLRQTKPDDWLAPFLELAGSLETRLAA